MDDFWLDGSSAERILVDRKKQREVDEREAYLMTWKGKRELEESQRNAIAGYLWSKEVI